MYVCVKGCINVCVCLPHSTCSNTSHKTHVNTQGAKENGKTKVISEAQLFDLINKVRPDPFVYILAVY